MIFIKSQLSKGKYMRETREYTTDRSCRVVLLNFIILFLFGDGRNSEQSVIETRLENAKGIYADKLLRKA